MYRAAVIGRIGPTVLVILALSAACATTAAAAELRWQAPPECPSAAQLAAEIEAMIGKPLAAVEAMDFEGVVEHGDAGRFALTLRMLPRSSALEPNARRVEAASCRELGGAAVVAIAMALGERDAAAASVPDADSTRAAPASSAAAAPASIDRARERTALRYGAALGVELDVGALPELALGGELQVSFGVRALRLVGLGTLFQAQDTRARGRQGFAEIRLAFGGLLACGEWMRAPLAWLGCGGVELGKLWGEGQGVMQPGSGDVAWRALRFELGLDMHVAPHVALVTRAGVSAPLSRPEFELGGERLHKPAPASFRAQLGVAFSFSSADRSSAQRRQTGE